MIEVNLFLFCSIIFENQFVLWLNSSIWQKPELLFRTPLWMFLAGFVSTLFLLSRGIHKGVMLKEHFIRSLADGHIIFKE